VTSIDANLLLYAYTEASPCHRRAYDILAEWAGRDDVAVSELVLAEFYTLLRHPAVLRQPLDAPEAVQVIQSYRQHPCWALVGCDPDSVGLHDELWERAGRTPFARRRIYDARLALSLRRQGVKAFATANVADFQDLGFDRVWNPLEET
jgi:toxin-antitoxin system PIN domain toxin